MEGEKIPFIFVDNGLTNFKYNLDESDSTKVEFLKGLTEKGFTNIRVTNDKTQAFLMNDKAELVQYNLNQSRLVENYGKIFQQYGNLFILDDKFSPDQDNVLMQFKHMTSHNTREEYIKNEEIALTEDHLKCETIFGSFVWQDQAWGNRKSGMKIMLNGKSVFYVKPGDCPHDEWNQGFSFKPSDYNAKVGDKVEFWYWTGAAGGHSLYIWNLILFSLPAVKEFFDENNPNFVYGGTNRPVNPYKGTTSQHKNGWVVDKKEMLWLGDNYYSKETHDDKDHLFLNQVFFNNKNGEWMKSRKYK